MESLLHSHPYFQGSTSKFFNHPPLKPIPNRDLIAITESGNEIFVFTSPKELSVINLSKFKLSKEKKEENDHTKTIASLPFDAQKITLSKSARYLCAYSSGQCAIVEISDRAKHLTTKKDILCRTFLVGNFFHSTHPTVKIQHALFHPLSSIHLAVLTSDNILRLYSIPKNIEEPEQIFRLYSLPLLPSLETDFTQNSNLINPSGSVIPRSPMRSNMPSPSYSPYSPSNKMDYTFMKSLNSPYSPYPYLAPMSMTPMHPTPSPAHTHENVTNAPKIEIPNAVSFTFGNSPIGWSQFTATFLMEDGSLYSLCPILPHYAPLSTNQILYLKQTTETLMHNLTEENWVGEYLREIYASQLRWIRDISGNYSVLADDEREDDNENLEYVRTCVPAYKFPSILQGPLENPENNKSECGENEANQTKINSKRACSISSISYTHFETSSDDDSDHTNVTPIPQDLPITVLVRTFEDGEINILLSTEESSPWFFTSKIKELTNYIYHSPKTLSAFFPRASLYQKLELSLSKSALDTPVIVLDPQQHEIFYIFHNTGVHAVSLPWLSKLGKSSDSASLMPSKLCSILTTKSPPPNQPVPILGICVLSDLCLGNEIVAMTPEKCITINLEKVRKWLLPQFSFTSTIPTSTSNFTQNFESPPLEMLSKSPAPIPKFAFPKLTSEKGIPVDQDGMQFILNMCQDLKKQYVIYLKALHTEIQNRVSLIHSAKEIQEQELMRSSNTLSSVAFKQDEIMEKIEKAKIGMNVLSNRSDLLSKAASGLFTTLSNAEKQHIRDIKIKHTQMLSLHDRVNELSLQVDNVLPSITSRSENNATGHPDFSKFRDSQNIKEADITRVRNLLEQEQQLISQVMSDLKKLKIKVDSAASSTELPVTTM